MQKLNTKAAEIGYKLKRKHNSEEERPMLQKNKKKISKFVTLIVLFSMLSCFMIPTALAWDSYPYSIDPYVYEPDMWNFYQCECTSFCAFCLNTRNGVNFHNYYGNVHWGNANNWISAAQSLGITVNQTPATGAIACWNNGDYGHVAWVSEVYSDGTVFIEEYNYNSNHQYNSRTISSTSPSAYIHIRDLSNSEDVTDFKVRYYEWDDKQWIGSTDATIAYFASVEGISPYSVSTVSVYVFDSDGDLIAQKSEDAYVDRNGKLGHYYTMNDELGIWLTPGSTYYYRYSATAFGIEKYSEPFGFTTAY